MENSKRVNLIMHRFTLQPHVHVLKIYHQNKSSIVATLRIDNKILFESKYLPGKYAIPDSVRNFD